MSEYYYTWGRFLQEDEGIVMAPSKFVPTVQEGFSTYTSMYSYYFIHPVRVILIRRYSLGVWQHRDETSNFMQKHDNEIVKEQKR